MSMNNWEKMLDKKIQLAIKEKSVVDGLNLRANPPFTAAIMNYVHPSKFKPPNLDLYDETKDLINHVQSLKSYIIFLGISNKIMCRSFTLAFRNIAWNWYSMLKPNSISCFTEFV